ncbi:MAG: MOSC domain-containing protein [Chloroflexota bacterium]|nr:MOSC domain-containing protein [Chloroflexota bacterium]
MPRVSRFSIAPVRSLGLEHPQTIDVTEVGVVEDRRFYLIDDAGRLVDRLVVEELVQIAAHTDPGATTLTMTFPDGRVLADEVGLAEHVQTPIHGRTGVGHVVIGPWAEALSAFCGRPIRLIRCDRPAGTRSGNPTSLVSDGSLAELARQGGVDAVDGRRFRMLIEVEGAQAHEEDTWVGKRIAIGDAVLAITQPDARCAITTQHPDTGNRDLDTLRMIIAYRGLRDGKNADFGVLGDVARPGAIRLGDEIAVLPDRAG